jgi:hypothetical protein
VNDNIVNNDSAIRQLEKEFNEASEKVFTEALENVYKATIEKHKDNLSKATIGNETTKKTTQFLIPIQDHYKIEKTDNAYSIVYWFTTGDDTGDLALLAAWHGTGLTINPEIMKYVKSVAQKNLEAIQPPQEEEDDPNSLSSMYFVPSYADTIFRDALINNSNEYEIAIDVKEA